MGFKSKATKANKAKKEDRKPIERKARGEQFTGFPTHIVRTRETAANSRRTAEEMFLRGLEGESTGMAIVKSATPSVVDKRTIAEHLRDEGSMKTVGRYGK